MKVIKSLFFVTLFWCIAFQIDKIHAMKQPLLGGGIYIPKYSEEYQLFVKACKENDIEAIKQLIIQGFDVTRSYKVSDERIPLHIACQYGDYDTVLFLLEQGACIHSQESDFGHDALYYACMYNTKQVVKLLLEYGAKMDQRYGLSEKDSVVYALCKDHNFLNLDTLQLLFDVLGYDVLHTFEHGKTMLHQACARSTHGALVEFLLENGADVNIEDENGNTPLHLLVKNFSSRELKKLIPFCIKYGVDMQIKNNDGQTPLHCLSDTFLATEDKVELLCNFYIDINAVDKKGKTALHLACAKNHSFLVDVLCQNGADIFVQDKKGNTPLHDACSNRYSDTAFKQLYMLYKPLIYKKNKNGETAFHYALKRNYTSIIQFLLQDGFDIEKYDEESSLVQYVLSSHSHYHGNFDVLALLLRFGVKVEEVYEIRNSRLFPMIEVLEGLEQEQIDRATFLENIGYNCDYLKALKPVLKKTPQWINRVLRQNNRYIWDTSRFNFLGALSAIDVCLKRRKQKKDCFLGTLEFEEININKDFVPYFIKKVAKQSASLPRGYSEYVQKSNDFYFSDETKNIFNTLLTVERAQLKQDDVCKKIYKELGYPNN